MIGTFRRNFSTSMLTVLCCSLIILTSSSIARGQRTGKLIVKVTGIHNAEGNIRVAVRTDETNIAAAQIATIDPKTLTAEAVFDGLPEGDYGVAVIHDENKDEKLDFTEFGMPTEGYGHSNNPSKRQGAPDFNETKFIFAAPTTAITINLIYWP